MDKKVSVIVTTFNRPELLKRAVNSIIRQSYKDWECLIVDDCGLEDNRKVARELMLQDSRIRYVRLKKNFGQHTRPKNIGTAYATTELIAYLDDDNTWRINHLEALVKKMEETNADLVWGDRVILDPDGKLKGPGVSIEQITKGQVHDFNLNVLVQQNYIDTNDVLLKKELLKEIGGWDDNCKRFADWNLFVRLGKLGKKLIHLNEIITDYYLYPDSNQLRHQGFMFDTIGCPTYINGKMPQKVAVFMLTKDRLEYTKKAIESMFKFTNHPFELFVIDNGSTDGTVEYLKELIKEGKIRQGCMLDFKENLGISKASNKALELIEGLGALVSITIKGSKEKPKLYKEPFDWIVKWDNDCVALTPHWLEDLLEYLNMSPKSFVGPYVEGLVDNPGGAQRVTYGTVGRFLFGPTFHVGGICNIAPAKLYAGFRWSEDDPLHGEQDVILSRHALSQGYQLGYLEETKVYHINSTVGQKKDFPEYFAKRLEEKVTKYKE